VLVSWDKLPSFMQNEEVRPYYEILWKKRWSLRIKRLLDIFLSLFLMILFLPLYLLLLIGIKVDSPGPVFFRQKRVTQYGKEFKIFKFRTMIQDAENTGSAVTIKNDIRVTRIGRFLRKYRLDETAQLLDIFRGTMTFVGTRPEIQKYVNTYTPAMLATLLLPAGVTSTASISYRNEQDILDNSKDVDQAYINEILPQKMEYNLSDIKNFSLLHDISIIWETIKAVFFKGNE
jgi:lipopolysaccharide/colanic/teichoic acid biosynthesis glycosyltransferase